MYLDLTRASISHFTLLAQLEQLQTLGYLDDSTMDFGATAETLAAQNSRLLAEIREGGSTARTSGLWTVDAFEARLRRALEEALDFRPAAATHFPPHQGILKRGVLEEPVPVIIEKVDFAEAVRLASFEGARREFEKFSLFLTADNMDVSVFLMRDWGGEVHAMAVTALHPYGETKTLLCLRDIKFDRNRKTAFRAVGPLLTVARLLYMRNAGYWAPEAPILTDIRPEILRAYRSHFPPLPPVRGSQGEWSVEHGEARHLLRLSTTTLVPLPLS